MIERPDKRLIEALADLEGNRNWEIIRAWLQECERQSTQACIDQVDDMQLRREQGAAQTLREINEISAEARNLVQSR